MKKILITQRSECHKERNEHRDALDQNFALFLSDAMHLIPLPNKTVNVKDFAKAIGCEGIIFSGGNEIVNSDTANCPYRLKAEKDLMNYAMETRLPVLGICYGMQVINSHLGGDIRPIKDHVKTIHAVTDGKHKIYVNSFHDNGMLHQDLSPSLEPLMTSTDGTIESFLHRTLPWIGIMWHPERELPGQEYWVEFLKKIFSNHLPTSRQAIKKMFYETLECLETK